MSVERLTREIDRLRLALERSNIIVITDRKGKIIHVNDEFCEITKYDRADLVRQNINIINSGFHNKDFFKEMWETIKTGEIWQGEVQNKAKDGSLFWVKSSIIPFLTDEGVPYQYCAIQTNITNVKEAEKLMLQSMETEFRNTVQRLRNMIFKIKEDEKGEFKYTLFEGKLTEKIGIREEIINKTSKDIFSVEIANKLEKHFKEAFQNKIITFEMQHGDSYYQVTLSPIENEEGIIEEIVGSANDITELKNAELKIKHLAYHDSLTGLPNRRMFQEELNNNLSIAKEKDKLLAVLFFDLDRFKNINDTLGHTTGDLLLKKVSERLLKLAPDKNKVYRLSGDEFIILLTNFNDTNYIREIAKSVIKSFENPFQLKGKEFYITTSMGISIYPSLGQDFESLITNADLALFYAKSQGKNNYQFYNEKLNSQQNEKLSIEMYLHKALGFEEFILHYQPKVDIESGKIVGTEALIRWIHPEFGFVSPSTFIPVAEESGLIVPIGEWILKEACRQNKEWHDNGFPYLGIAVNISGLQFIQPNFVETVEKILKETGLDPKYLELEITENMLMQNSEDNLETLLQLKKMGVTLSIDDFGTGYSSLSYLKKFPVDTLKIDRQFIKDIPIDEKDLAIVESVINLSHNLKFIVVAEGVENEEQTGFLKGKKCDQIQGYFYSKPLPAAQLEELLKANKENPYK